MVGERKGRRRWSILHLRCSRTKVSRALCQVSRQDLSHRRRSIFRSLWLLGGTSSKQPSPHPNRHAPCVHWHPLECYVPAATRNIELAVLLSDLLSLTKGDDVSREDAKLSVESWVPISRRTRRLLVKFWEKFEMRKEGLPGTAKQQRKRLCISLPRSSTINCKARLFSKKAGEIVVFISPSFMSFMYVKKVKL